MLDKKLFLVVFFIIREISKEIRDTKIFRWLVNKKIIREIDNVFDKEELDEEDLSINLDRYSKIIAVISNTKRDFDDAIIWE